MYNQIYLSKIIPSIKPYYTCCICFEKSNKVTKCSKCIDGIICYNCNCEIKKNNMLACPICRYKSDNFNIKSKIKILHEKVGNLVILYTLIFFLDQLLPEE